LLYLNKIELLYLAIIIMKRTRKVKRHPRRSYRRHMNSMNGGVKNTTLKAEKEAEKEALKAQKKAQKEAFKARKKADKEEEKKTDKELLTKAELAKLNAARKEAAIRIKAEKIRVKAQDAQWKLEEIENKARRKKEAEEFKYNNLAKREFQKDPLLKKKAKQEAEKDPDYLWKGLEERKKMVQYYLDGFWIMLGEEKRDALVAQAKEKAEAKKTK
jgi:hypothetical protein